MMIYRSRRSYILSATEVLHVFLTKDVGLQKLSGFAIVL